MLDVLGCLAGRLLPRDIWTLCCVGRWGFVVWLLTLPCVGCCMCWLGCMSFEGLLLRCDCLRISLVFSRVGGWIYITCVIRRLSLRLGVLLGLIVHGLRSLASGVACGQFCVLIECVCYVGVIRLVYAG